MPFPQWSLNEIIFVWLPDKTPKSSSWTFLKAVVKTWIFTSPTPPKEKTTWMGWVPSPGLG